MDETICVTEKTCGWCAHIDVCYVHTSYISFMDDFERAGVDDVGHVKFKKTRYILDRIIANQCQAFLELEEN